MEMKNGCLWGPPAAFNDVEVPISNVLRGEPQTGGARSATLAGPTPLALGFEWDPSGDHLYLYVNAEGGEGRHEGNTVVE